MKKTNPCVCPKCGDNNVEYLEHNIEDSTLHDELQCRKCSAQWDEYFELTYKGYAYEGIDYKESGEEMYTQ